MHLTALPPITALLGSSSFLRLQRYRPLYIHNSCGIVTFNKVKHLFLLHSHPNHFEIFLKKKKQPSDKKSCDVQRIPTYIKENVFYCQYGNTQQIEITPCTKSFFYKISHFNERLLILTNNKEWFLYIITCWYTELWWKKQ